MNGSSIISLWTRALNRLYTTMMQLLKEREFSSSEGQSIRYMFFPCRKSNTLVIGFQACNDAGARYNYVRTIQNCGVNRLFIKDDFGPNHCGDYYLGSNGTYSVEKAVYALIDLFIDRTHPSKIIFIGSSKGGYAALNFGLSYPAANIVIAAPQYYLGSYLDNPKWKENLEEILGENVSEENKRALDLRLKRKISGDMFGNSQTIYIHYSDQEHTYKEHVKDLLEDLNGSGISIHTDAGKYSVHEELKHYFPDYLQKTIREIQKNVI